MWAFRVADTSPVTLPIHCVKCGQPVTVSYTRSGAYTVQHWTCPYVECQAINQVILGGTGLFRQPGDRPLSPTRGTSYPEGGAPAQIHAGTVLEYFPSGTLQKVGI